MARRPSRAAVGSSISLLAFLTFGVARVVAPVSALGLVFAEPWTFALAAAVTSVAGALLLFARPVELAVARVIAGPTRVPSRAEGARLEPLLGRLARRTGVQAKRLILRIQEDPGTNASAGAGHLLFVTDGALRMSDEELEAVLAHEMGHHRGLHPVLAAVVWWLRMPGAALAVVYRMLRRAVVACRGRLGAPGRVLGLVALALLAIWQVAVMWIFYAGELLALHAARLSEFEADTAACRWGYAGRLASAYEAMSAHEAEPSGRFARLMADHPPLAERITRLRQSDAAKVYTEPVPG